MRATVIIPTCGRALSLERAVRSLLLAEAGTVDVEILVVDNNADEATSGEVRATCAAAGDAIRYTAETSPGQTAARHRGAAEARSEILIYIDDDVVVSSDWLNALLKVFEDDRVGIAGGPSIPLFTGSIPSWLWDFLRPTPYGGWHCGWLSLLDIGSDVADIDPVWIWGLNFAIRRDVLYQLGGFHPDLVPPAMQRWQGDGETGLAIKAKTSGTRSMYVHGALVQHVIGPDRLSLQYFARRAYYQGVCDSFTSIRLGTPPSFLGAGPKAMPVVPNGAGGWAQTAHEVKWHATAAYNDGWLFHQRESALDPSLLNWIRRTSYWSADIREEMLTHESP